MLLRVKFIDGDEEMIECFSWNYNPQYEMFEIEYDNGNARVMPREFVKSIEEIDAD